MPSKRTSKVANLKRHRSTPTAMFRGDLESAKIRAKDLPGMMLILLALYITVFTIVTPVLYQLGIPIPIRYVNLIGWVMVFPVVVVGAFTYAKAEKLHLLYRKSHLMKIQLWFALIVPLAIYGAYLGAPIDDIIKEGIAFTYFGIFLLLGGDDRFWHILLRHLLIIFYVGAILILLFYDTPGLTVTETGVLKDSLASVNYRSTDSIGYSLRPLIASGLLLGVWGMVQRRVKNNQSFYIGAIVVFFAINTVIFLFRSSAITALAILFLFVLYRPFLEQRLRLGKSSTLLVISILALGYYTTTESFYEISQRMFGGASTVTVDVLGSRELELNAYMDDMGWEVLVGRGLGGTFDASSVYLNKESPEKWATLHYGMLVFTLKGGIICLLSFISFYWSGLTPRRTAWYQNPCNLTAALLYPLILVSSILNPFSISPGAIIEFLILSMVFARFGRRTKLDLVSAKR